MLFSVPLISLNFCFAEINELSSWGFDWVINFIEYLWQLDVMPGKTWNCILMRMEFKKKKKYQKNPTEYSEKVLPPPPPALSGKRQGPRLGSEHASGRDPPSSSPEQTTDEMCCNVRCRRARRSESRRLECCAVVRFLGLEFAKKKRLDEFCNLHRGHCNAHSSHGLNPGGEIKTF